MSSGITEESREIPPLQDKLKKAIEYSHHQQVIVSRPYGLWLMKIYHEEAGYITGSGRTLNEAATVLVAACDRAAQGRGVERWTV